MKYFKFITRLITIFVFSFFVLACDTQKTHISDTSGLGFTVSDNTISQNKAEEISHAILPDNLLEKYSFKFLKSVKPNVYLVDYGIKGKLLNIDRRLSEKDNKLTVHIESRTSTKVRHDFMINVDKEKWYIIKKETAKLEYSSFNEIYLFQHENKSLFQGIMFMDGVWVVFQWNGTPSNKNIKKLENIIWEIAENLKDNYLTKILPIVKEFDD